MLFQKRIEFWVLFWVLTGTVAGCQSTLNRPGWLQPRPKTAAQCGVRGQAPVPVSDSFSSADTAPIPAQPMPSMPSMPPIQPGAVSPAVSSPLPNSPSNSLPNPLPDDPWAEIISQTQTMPTGIHSSVAPPSMSPNAAPVAGNYSFTPQTKVNDDPWGIQPNGSPQKTVSVEEAAQREEAEAVERQRLTELATAQQKDGTPEYLKPLENWDGPFVNREKKQTLEQEIIRQVGYEDVTPEYDNTPVYDWEKEEEKGFDWELLDPVNFFTKVRDWVGLGPDEIKANAAMKRGREILLSNPDLKDKKKNQEAAKEFSEAAKRWPDSVLEEDALHLAGECYYFADDYPRALKAYQKLLIKYQHSKYLDNDVRRLFKIAKYWEEEDRRGVSSVNMTAKERPTFDTFGHCKKAYETIFINDPNGPISDSAVMSLATAYLLKGQYQGDYNYSQAAYYYQFLRENYPLSQYITQAHENELFARTNAYMGAEHNGKNLEEAGKLADLTLRQFGSELETEEKDDILGLKEDVINKQAEREWTMGQFFDKKQYYGSAKLYYTKLLDKYPQTDYAERARVRLEQIKDMPDRPKENGFIKALLKPLEKI